MTDVPMSIPALPPSAIWTATAVLALATVLFALLSTLLERSGPVRLRLWAEDAGGRISDLYREAHRFDAFRSLLGLLAKATPVVLAVSGALALGAEGGAAGAVRVPTALGRFSDLGPVLAAAAAVVGLLALVEIAGRIVVARAPEEALRRMTPLYRMTRGMLRPFTSVLVSLYARRTPELPEEEEEASDEEIEAFIAFGTREGILEPEEGEMVWGIVDLGETEVRSVMTPRIDVYGAPVESDLETLARLFLDCGHSRLPLFEGSLDRIVGVLHIRDLLRALRDPQAPPPAALATPPFVVPETKHLDELLRQMQASHRQMAVVVDEYGGTAGVVTVEDLLEEIVGEIIDEHEVEESEIQELPDGSWRIDGRVRVEDLADELGVDFDDEKAPYETVGGLILSTLGDVPTTGEVVEWQGYRLEVESVDERRVEAVRAARRAEPPPAAVDATLGEEGEVEGEEKVERTVVSRGTEGRA